MGNRQRFGGVLVLLSGISWQTVNYTFSILATEFNNISNTNLFSYLL